MKRKILLLIIVTCLAIMLPVHGALLAAEREPEVGHYVGNVSFSTPIAPEGATYLGLAKPSPFTLRDIKADYVLVESFNTTCPYCKQQATVLNALFNGVENDPKLKNKLKFLAAAQGQDRTEAWMWKRSQRVPFPVVPDIDSKFGKALNFSPYPVTVVLNKSGKVVWVHIGVFGDPDRAFREIVKVVGVEVTTRGNFTKDVYISKEVYTSNDFQFGRFTRSNIMKIRVGMTQKEVESIFGIPNRTEVTTFGGDTPSGPWQGLRYYYDQDKKTSITPLWNEFVFSLEKKPPKLNHWRILFNN